MLAGHSVPSQRNGTGCPGWNCLAAVGYLSSANGLFFDCLQLPEGPQIIDPVEEHDGNQRSEFCADINLSFGKNLKNYQCH
jgi:hypothetical protein